MKIAYVIQNPGMSLSEGQGTQLHVRGVVEGMQQAGHKVRLLALQQGRTVLAIDDPGSIGTGTVRGVSLVELGITGSKLFKCVESGIRRIQTELRVPYFALWDSLRLYDGCRQTIDGYDILHAHFDLFPLGAVLTSRRMMIPLVLDCEADYFEEMRYLGHELSPLQERWARWCQRLCFETARAVISVSDELKHHLIENWNIPSSKIHVLPNVVDIKAFGSTEGMEEWGQKLGLGRELTVVFVGGFYKWHALDQLVESFAKVLQSIPSCWLLLVGDGSMRDDVEAKVNQLGIQRAVLWTGMVDHPGIPALLGLADVAVAPFTEFFPGQGGSALKLFEYMASGKAIVATATGQVADVIAHGVNGLLVKPGDVEGFAAAIVQLLSDPAERERLGRNARQQATEQHSWEQYGRRLEEIYLSVL